MNTAIGIDVGKKELVARIRCSNGITEPPASFPNSSIGLKRLVRYMSENTITSDTPILLESTGPYHWEAACILTENHYAARVVNPLHTKHILRHSIRKRKTDSVDAGHLAFLASQGYGYPFRETRELAQRKALVRHYWKLKSTTTQHKAHEAYVSEYRGISKFKISPYILKTTERVKEEIITIFSKGNDLRYLDSIPGVSPILGATILAEIMPIERFTRIEQLIAYAGLDPSVKQSGSHPAKHGRISKRGSPILRRALYLAAFGCFSHKPFSPLYQKYKGRNLHHTTILCILARKILRTSVTLLKKREEFDKLKVDVT
jgi:transposase